MSRWICCKDEMPPEDETVLIAYWDLRDNPTLTYLLGSVRHHGRLQPIGYCGNFSERVTHWRRIPKPPFPDLKESKS